MREIKSYAVFEANFPDDSREHSGDIVEPAGRNIIEAICRNLSTVGVEVTALEQQSFYGWTAKFTFEKSLIRLLLQHPGPWLLIVEARGWWLAGATSKVNVILDAIALVAKAVSTEKRIKEVRWMSENEFRALARNVKRD
jgi:hypothetical protein